MRLGIVRGHVVLNPVVPELKGVRFVVVEPVNLDDLRAANGKASGKALVAVDALGAAVGQTVGVTEGREAANPFWPERAPVDAYCALIVKHVAFQSTRTLGPRSEVRP
jgi:ethanolamine utilization protein EutN